MQLLLDEIGVLDLKFTLIMRIFSRVLWIVAFVVATYCWMVAFEHGFNWKGFSSGFTVEWKNVGALLMGKPTDNPAHS